MNLNDKDRLLVTQVIEYLNARAGSSYDTDSSINIQYILDRHKDGYFLAHFKTVIDKKCNEWLGTDYAPYLRPITLFSKKNFENYLNAPERTNQKTAKSSLQNIGSAVDTAKRHDWGLGGDEG